MITLHSDTASTEHPRFRNSYGDAAALEQASVFFPHMYKELECIAYRSFTNSRPKESINIAALVNEAYLKVFRYTMSLSEKAHLMSLAASAMRQIIVSYAEQSGNDRDGEVGLKLIFDDAFSSQHRSSTRSCDLNTALLIDRALGKVKALDPTLEQILEQRLFAGMTEGEIASAMNIRQHSVRRHWKKASPLLMQFIDAETHSSAV